jgi:opacity protein-like surface antigen
VFYGAAPTNAATGTSVTSGRNTASGWLVGGGIAWAFAYSRTMKLEYDRLGLGNRSFTVPTTAPTRAPRARSGHSNCQAQMTNIECPTFFESGTFRSENRNDISA